MEKERLAVCAAEMRDESLGPRFDAQASLHWTRVGGWLPVLGHDGRLYTKVSPWFSDKTTRQGYPWVDRKDGTGSRIGGVGNIVGGLGFLPSRRERSTCATTCCVINHGQQKKRSSSQQAHNDPFPVFGSADGIHRAAAAHGCQDRGSLGPD